MSKTESTAVNALIDLVGQKPVDLGDDSANSMFRSPSAPVAAQASPPPPRPPRMTGQVPAMRGAGEIAPLPPPRAASGTQSDLPPSVRMMTAPPARLTTIPPLGGVKTTGTMPPLPNRQSRALPPPRPGTQQRAAQGTPAPELFSRSGATLAPPVPQSGRTEAPEGMPIAAPFETSSPAPASPTPPIVAMRSQPVPPPAMIDQTNGDSWFEATREGSKIEVVDETWSGTLAVPRQSLGLRKLAMPGAVLAVAAVLLGGYAAFSGEGKHHATAATDKAAAVAPAPAALAAAMPVGAPAAVVPAVAAAAPADPAPAPAPPAPEPLAPAPVAAPAVVPAAPGSVAHLVSVRFDSQPTGATVMLVDGGKTSFLGTAPIDASVDTSRAYDVVFTLEGHPTQVQHLDAAATQHITGMLAGQPAPVAAPVAPAIVAQPTPLPVAPPVHHHHVATSAPVSAPSAPVAARASASGKGVLMVSSKPPCDIVIDGRPTGLTTPQRAISLTAGSHRVTLINASDNLTKTVNVTINAAQPTKLIQNLLK